MTNVVFFEGFDSGPGDDLWETNGTVSGSFAIGGIANAGVVGASAGGLGPIFDLAAFGDGVLFQGFDANSGYGLWTSNGTAAGTVEIGGLDNAGVTGAYSQGLDPSSITVLGGQAIFLGDDSNYASKYAQSLWMTDGTNSGTTEIGGLGNAGIADKYASGWNPAGFTAIGGEVFFTATDSVDYTGIWVTNGAAAGTIEIGGLKNAGIAGAPTTAFEPSAFLSLGSKALFENSGLWVSNGTAARTTEISTVVGLDLTVVGNEGYFSGDDSSGDPTLWETNGTAAGTIEIGGVANAGVSGADSKGLNPSNFTALGNEVVFTGSDASGAQNLWITNGSATGTVEIGGLANAGVNGAVGASGLAPQTFASLGDKVLFTGQDSSGQWGLWVTDGTSGGTFEIGGVNNAGVTGAPSGGLTTQSFLVSGGLAYFDSNDANGVNALWVSDATVAGTYELNPTTENSSGFAADQLTAASGSVACYCRGSLIETEHGATPVESLSIGDRVTTLDGKAKPIKWIGMRSYEGRFVAGNREVLPIRIRAGALDENIPSRDLWLSPHHALYLEGVLIEAKDLVNGVSIIQAETTGRVDYFHVELFDHDVIFAEGAPAESFVDNDSRAMFQNVGDYLALYQDDERRIPPPFAPRRDEGFELEAARQKIAARAGVASEPRAPGELRGWVEGASSEGLWGWAQNAGDPQTAVCIDVLADGCLVGRVLANRFRADLETAGLGEGRCAFHFEAPEGVDFAKARVELRRASDGAALPSPAFFCAA